MMKLRIDRSEEKYLIDPNPLTCPAAARKRGQEKTHKTDSDASQTRFTVISNSRSIYVKSVSADLDRESHTLLDEVAEITKRCPALEIEISGHRDSIGSRATNQTLSEQRARSVVAYLVDRGVDPGSLHPVGYGDTRPKAPNDTRENQARNPRIEFHIMQTSKL